MKRFYGVASVDFDGVIHDMATNDIVPGARESLRRLSKQMRIVVLTANTPSWVRQWLIAHGLSQYVHEVTDIKPVADFYLDDRGIRFTDWPSAMREIRALIH